MAARVDVDTYTGCGACVGVCSVGVLSMNDDGKSVCNEGICTNYGSCVSACPASVIFQ